MKHLKQFNEVNETKSIEDKIVKILEKNAKEGWNGDVEAVGYIDFEKVAKQINKMFSKLEAYAIRDDEDENQQKIDNFSGKIDTMINKLDLDFIKYYKINKYCI